MMLDLEVLYSVHVRTVTEPLCLLFLSLKYIVSREEDSICEGINCQLSAGVLAAIFSGAAVLLILLCLSVGCGIRTSQQW